jgi:hypothetical membrane protein
VGSAVTIGRWAPRVGMIGSAAIAVCSVVAAIAYRGADGELYSPLNHYVSELGELGVSSLAAIFNSGLIVGGVCFAAFIAGLGRTRGGVGGAVYAGVGVLSGVAGALVGVFPLNNLVTHTVVASSFFNLTWIAIALASVDIIVRPDPRFPARLAVVGFAAVAGFIGFIWAYAAGASGDGNGLEPQSSGRLSLDPSTILEWAAVIGVVIWTFWVAAAWERAARASVA